MADRLSEAQRSAVMSRVRNRDTAPEMAVRSLLHRMGYRFRLHRRDLPGTPDIVLPRHRKAIFVNGCFWHGHDCPRGRRPSSRTRFWNEKLDRNMARDRESHDGLVNLGWQVMVVWECELKDLTVLEGRLHDFMERKRSDA